MLVCFAYNNRSVETFAFYRRVETVKLHFIASVFFLKKYKINKRNISFLADDLNKRKNTQTQKESNLAEIVFKQQFLRIEIIVEILLLLYFRNLLFLDLPIKPRKQTKNMSHLLFSQKETSILCLDYLSTILRCC